MKQKMKRSVSLLLILCMVITLLPGKVAVAADGDPINITRQPVPEVTVDYKDDGTNYEELVVEAVSVSGSALSYQWYSKDKISNAEEVKLTNGTSHTLKVPEDTEINYEATSPGKWEFRCKISDDLGNYVFSDPTTFTINKATYTGTLADTVIVKTNTVQAGIRYDLPEQITYAFWNKGGQKNVTYIGSLVESAEQGYDVWTDSAYLLFNVKSVAAVTSSAIQLKVTNSYYYTDTTFVLTVTAADVINADITGITAAHRVYDGTPWKGYTGTPAAGSYPGEYVFHYTGTEASGNSYDAYTAPVNAGEYKLTISIPDTVTDYIVTPYEIDFKIEKREVQVSIVDSSMHRETTPLIVFNYIGFIGTDMWNKENCLSEWAEVELPANIDEPGDYPLTFSAYAKLNNTRGTNYYLTHVPGGTLTVLPTYGGYEILSTNLPDAVIDKENAFINASVENGVSSFILDFTVSTNATWTLYKDFDFENWTFIDEIPNKQVALEVGENTFCTKVVAEHGASIRRYIVTITRQEKPAVTPTPQPTSAPQPTPTQPTSGYEDTSSDFAVDGSNTESWNKVLDGIQGEASRQINITMTGTTVIPGTILKELAEKNMTATFVLEDGISWTIHGDEIEQGKDRDTPIDFKDIDLKAKLGAGEIPKEVLEELAEQTGAEAETEILLLSLFHEGTFGFKARLSLNIGSQLTGRTANLFYYNKATGKLELISMATVDSEGNIVFPFAHASDYAIVIDDGAKLQAELDKITLTPAKKTLYVGGNTGRSTTLKLSLPDSLSTLAEEDSLYLKTTYTSSNTKIATVTAEGKVTAKKAGKAVITATITSGEHTKTLKSNITVNKASIKIVKSKESLKKGQSFTYTAAGYGITKDKITWVTIEKAIVVIDKKTGKAIAKTTGTDTVVVKYGTIKESIKVTVK